MGVMERCREMERWSDGEVVTWSDERMGKVGR